ncbi:glycogen synthase GlgA [Bacilliculturomica massiliensis]|uniref:glycogen synthase GlgA n=1 Tax=Bacilliculturomica massiliensis TaxID=1917867 RepID=UPI001031EFF0|nr:glycogen synthase GlgA [Bacilliculturomica massiliensis]
MNVLFISTEAAPFAKSGGLGDVIGALPAELMRQGAEVRVMLPLYKSIHDKYMSQMTYVTNYEVALSWRRQYCGLFQMEYGGVTFYFIDNEYYFKRDGYYGYYDDGERFAWFSKACLETLKHISFDPDILHCSEWQTAMTPVYLKTLYRSAPGYDRLRTVFTIHNIEYQGVFGPETLSDLFGLDKRDAGLVTWRKDVNVMKGAVVACDKLTTVSPTYAEEIRYPFYGRGLEDIIRENDYKLSGIRNGIDTVLFNPAKDKLIPVNYTFKTIAKKKQNKQALQERLGLAVCEETPIIAMVGRLAEHKGIDLVIRTFDDLMRNQVQFVLLGTGEKRYEDFFNMKAYDYGDRAAAVTAFSTDLANLIYAGSDLFLMPSISEPCGLSQMIAMRYGTIPVVRETGGLKDSVDPYNPKTGKGNGVTFASVNAHDMLNAVERALELYGDKTHWKKLVGNAMKSDFSWKESAERYAELYDSLAF